MAASSTPIRVAFLMQNYAPIIGGAERQVASQAEVLSSLGVDVHVLTRRRRREHPRLERCGRVWVHRLPAPGPKPIAAAAYTLSALWELRRLKPDILHAQELLSPTTAAILGRQLFHTPVIAKVLGGGALGDMAKLHRGALGGLRMSVVLRSVDAFAVVSREIDAELQAAGVPAEKRVFIPNGVDTDRFSPASTEQKTSLRDRLGLPDARLVIFAGRLEPEKQVEQLLQLWPQVVSRNPDAHLLVLGAGSLEPKLRQQPIDRVHFLGGVEDVAPYMQACDVFVLPSLREGLSNSMLEAMACGLPVVATDVGGAADVITDWENGLLVQPGEPAALLQALTSLLRDPVRCALLGEKARALVLQRYALRSVANELRTLYDRILAGRATASKDSGST